MASEKKKDFSNTLWKGCLNPKEYYTKYIKEDNREQYIKRKMLHEKALSVIHKFDDSEEQRKHLYQRNYDMYMGRLEKEE